MDFEDDIEVVGETEDGQDTLAKTLVLQPDILLLDLNMPGLSGMEVCRQLLAARSKAKIIALTIHDNDNYVVELLKNGAKGSLRTGLKGVEPGVLLEAVRRVAEGGFYIHLSCRKGSLGS